MKIKYKLMMLFILTALLSFIAIQFFILRNEAIFKDYLGKQTIDLADSTIYEIDREISEKIDESRFHAESLTVIEEIEKSNNLFDTLDNRKSYIDQIDTSWNNESNKTDVLITQILENKGSIRLRDIKEFYEKENNITVYPEIFVTNKYGALVSSTGKTSDYGQNDEEWWKIAKEKGVYLEEPIYDESSGETGLIIASSIYNKQGEFIGVIKELLSVKSIEKIIQDAVMQSGNTQIKLMSNQGKIIFQSKNTPYNLTDFSKYSLFQQLNKQRGYITAKEEWGIEDSEEEIIISYSKSSGYDNFKGFGWVVLIENDLKKALSPAIELKKRMIYLSIIIDILLIGIGIFFSYEITKPIEKIRKQAEKIAKNSSEADLDLKSNDEIGELASTINNMKNEIKISRKALENSNKELETKVKQRTGELEIKNKELERINKLSIGRELRMIELKKELEKVKGDR